MSDRQARPFPGLLSVLLLLPVLLFIPGVALRFARVSNEWAVVLFLIPMLIELAAVPIAIVFLFRGYRTARNVLLTLVAAIPALVFLGMWFVNYMSHIHM